MGILRALCEVIESRPRESVERGVLYFGRDQADRGVGRIVERARALLAIAEITRCARPREREVIEMRFGLKDGHLAPRDLA